MDDKLKMVIICYIEKDKYCFNSIEELNKFKKYDDITYLDCRNNEITKIEKMLPYALKIFYCDNNRITKIENLSNNLQRFNCSYNQITRI